MHKLTDKERQIAGAALLSLSLGCILGMYMGILTSEYRWLSPPARKTASGKLGYERSASLGRAAAIDATKNPQDLNKAYQDMYQLAQEYEEQLRSSQ